MTKNRTFRRWCHRISGSAMEEIAEAANDTKSNQMIARPPNRLNFRLATIQPDDQRFRDDPCRRPFAVTA